MENGYHKGFNKAAFMAYLRYQFPGPFGGAGSGFTTEIIDNLIEYAQKYEHVAKNQFCEFLARFIPEVEFGEVAAFTEDGCLTEYGIRERELAMEEHDIQVSNENGITCVTVDGKELLI